MDMGMTQQNSRDNEHALAIESTHRSTDDDSKVIDKSASGIREQRPISIKSVAISNPTLPKMIGQVNTEIKLVARAAAGKAMVETQAHNLVQQKSLGREAAGALDRVYHEEKLDSPRTRPRWWLQVDYSAPTL